MVMHVRGGDVVVVVVREGQEVMVVNVMVEVGGNADGGNARGIYIRWWWW